MKFSPVLFALPRENEEFSSDNEEEPKIQEHEEQSKQEKEEFVVREATTPNEFWASALLKAEAFYGDQSHDHFELMQCAEEEYIDMLEKYETSEINPFMCVIAVRKQDENVIGTLDFYIKEYSQLQKEELVKALRERTAKNLKRTGRISSVVVDKSARQQGVGSSMLEFAIEYAKQKGGITEIYVEPDRDDEPALGLYRKMGFKILAEESAHPYYEQQNLYLCRLDL